MWSDFKDAGFPKAVGVYFISLCFFCFFKGLHGSGFGPVNVYEMRVMWVFETT
jgi:hypothetical protein